MKLRILFSVVLVVLMGCSNQYSQDVTPTTAEVPSGYFGLANHLYISQAYKEYIEQRELPVLSALSLDEEATAKVIRQMIAPDATVEEVAIEGSLQYQISESNGERSGRFFQSPLNTVIAMSSPDSMELYTVATNYLFAQMEYPQIDLLLDQELSLSFEQAQQMIEETMEQLNIEFEYTMYFYAISPMGQAVIEQEKLEAILSDKDVLLDFNVPKEYYFVEIFPKVEGLSVLYGQPLGSPENLTSVFPPKVQVLISQEGIESFDLMGMFPGEASGEKYSVDSERLFEALPKLLVPTIDGGSYLIETIELIYAPQRQVINEVDTYVYRPLWNVHYYYQEQEYQLFVDPESGQEVK